MSKLNNQNVVILSIVFTIVVIVIASLVAISKTNILSQAYLTNSLSPGCYYQLNCPPINRGNRPQFNCAPIMVCPSPTINPSPTLGKSTITCRDCIATGNTTLCFDPTAQASYCSSSIIADSNVSC